MTEKRYIRVQGWRSDGAVVKFEMAEPAREDWDLFGLLLCEAFDKLDEERLIVDGAA